MRYTIDSERSSIVIVASSSVHPIRAEAPRMSGWFTAGSVGAAGQDARDVVEGEVVVDASALRTDNPLVERELKRRIDVGKYPSITATTTGCVASDGQRVSVTGEITFLGRTVAVAGILDISTGGPDNEAHLVGQQTLDVRSWGLQPPKFLLFKVSPEVEVAVDLVGIPG